MSYDACIFGNGLTLGILNRIKQLIPIEKRYLLHFYELLQNFAFDIDKDDGVLDRIHELFRLEAGVTWNIENLRKLESFKKFLQWFLKNYHGKIELFYSELIRATVKEEYYQDVKVRFQITAYMYNIWYFILKDYLSTYAKKREIQHEIDLYYTLFNKACGTNCRLCTVNFDDFSSVLHPERLHGKFLEELVAMEDITIPIGSDLCEEIGLNKQDKPFYLKQLWGANGLDKGNAVKTLYKIPDSSEYYDLDFLVQMDNSYPSILIYGMAFSPTNEVLKPDNTISKLFSYIDGHILVALWCLQKKGLNQNITFCYKTDDDYKNYGDIIALGGYRANRVSCETLFPSNQPIML